MTPPPITTRCFGTTGILSAPMFESTRSSSNLRKGSSIGSDPVAMMTFFASYVVRRSVGAGDVDEVAGAQRAAPLRPRDLVLPEEELDALRVLRHDVVLALEHAREVDLDVADADAVLGGVLAQELDVLGRVEERLGRDAADVDAGAAERLVHLDADGVEAKLGGADGGNVSARAAADDDDVGWCVRSHGFQERERDGSA